MRLLLFILSVMVLSSCGPAYHLRKAKKHLLLAEAKGASITADTIFRDVPVPQVRVDTTVKFITLEKLLHDTITVVQNKTVVKIKYQEKEKTIYVNVEPEKKKETMRVPVIVNKKIVSGHTNFRLIMASLLALIIGFVVGVIYKSRRGKSE
jgi:hypothetical protein